MKQLYFLKQPREITFLFLVFSLLFSSCEVEKEAYPSIDCASQKRGSSGGSSQNTDPVYKDNFQTYLRIWLTNTKIRIDNMEPSEEYNPVGAPFNIEYNPPNTTKNLPGNQIGISFGPEFIQKGGRINSGSTKIVTTFNYIELPVLFTYRHNMISGANITAGAGPYFSYGIGGNTKITSNGQTTKAKVFSTGGYKRFDAGLTAAVHYMFPSSVSIGLSYDLGLTNILSTSGVSTKNRCLSLSVGYSLNKLFPERKKEK